MKRTWPLVAAIATWIALAILLPDLDPEEGRGEFERRHGPFPRFWCPACRVVEERIVDHPLTSNLAAIVQLVVLASIVAGVAAVVRRSGTVALGDRDERIRRERAERAARRDARARRDTDGGDA